MKVSKQWLTEMVDLNVSIEELEELIPLRIQGGINEVTDNYFELDLKGYNRADLLSMRGVAQEVAAITESGIKYHESGNENVIASAAKQSQLNVTVNNPKLCPVYCLAKIEGLSVGVSQDSIKEKLEAAGMRTINDIADVTNYIMLEFGQPLHAFDAKAVKDEAIIVRTAEKGERVTTLDGKTRDLQETDLLITDSKNALGIAGVMGGKDSEITDNTTTILLEAANFDPISIRKTAQRLGLHSEASKRFQHGLTKTRLLQALDAAIRMYENLGGRLTALTIVGETTDPVKTVELSLEKVNNLTGVELTAKQVEEYLTSLGFKLATKGDALCAWEVTVPYWRLDIEIEEDLIEEVARLYGYENIPAKELKGELPEKIDQSLFNLINDLKQKLVGVGLTEVQTYSYYSTKVLEALGFDEDNKKILVKIANPMSAETEYLRQNIWPNLLEVVDKNLRQNFDDIAIFEIGKVYSPVKDGLPKEEYRLSIALMNGLDNPLAELHKIVKQLLPDLIMRENSSEIKTDPLFHPKRFLVMEKGGKQVGGIAEVHPRVLDNLGINKRLAVLEISIEKL